VRLLSVVVSRRRNAWLTLLVALLAAVGVFLLPEPPAEQFRAGVATLPESYSSVRAAELLARFPSARVQPAIVVISRKDGAALSAAERDAIDAKLPALRRFVAGGQMPAVHVAPDGTVAVVAVPLDADEDTVDDRVGALRAELADGLPAGTLAQVTGEPAFTTDLTKVFDGANVALLGTTLLVVAVLLLVTYRSPILWLIPLGVVALTEQVTLRLVQDLLHGLDLTQQGATLAITSVLVFGAATDYALLVIARYRDELRVTEDRFAAMGTALRRTAEAILASGATVALAMLTLLLAVVEGSRAMGVAGAVGIGMAMLSALVVLPAALVLCGRGVFWPLVPRVGSAGTRGRVWARIGGAVARRPAAVVAVGLVLLATLSAAAAGVEVGLPQTGQFRAKPEAVRGAETLARAFPAGATQPVEVVARAGEATRVAEVARGVSGVAAATVDETADDLAKVTVILKPEPGTAASDEAIRAVRKAVAAVPGADAAAGGQAVATLDSLDAYDRDTRLVIPIILTLIGLVLLVLLRSVLAPLLLLVTVVLSFFASLGLSWLLFTHVLGYPALDNGVLLLSFLLLTALGVDYNIFLVTRVREDAAELGTRRGMTNALRMTGGVITSAGILLAAVFAVLGVIPLIALAQIGTVVCIGVLLDALLVRTVLVPALVFLLGDRFWWPARASDSVAR
jgi:RND superfamily putative drug exporter